MTIDGRETGRVLVRLGDDADEQAVLDAARAAGSGPPLRPRRAVAGRALPRGGDELIRRDIVALVARREVQERAGQRAFKIATGLMLLLVVGLVLISKIGGDSQSATVGTSGPGAAELARLALPRAPPPGST